MAAVGIIPTIPTIEPVISGRKSSLYANLKLKEVRWIRKSTLKKKKKKKYTVNCVLCLVSYDRNRNNANCPLSNHSKKPVSQRNIMESFLEKKNQENGFSTKARLGAKNIREMS